MNSASKVAITGANGFLGSWLTKELLNQGHQVRVVVRKTSDVSELQDLACEYFYGDITDVESLKKAFEGMDAVFHLAGLIAYRAADRDNMEKINVGGTKNVISAVLAMSVPRLVHVSSVVAIGAGFTSHDILNEESKYNISYLNLGYFQTKHAAELVVKQAVEAKGLDAVIVNPSTTYGPGDARKGSRSTQIKVARGGFPFYTSGGVNVIAVEEVVKGMISAWKKGKKGERYILAGENITIKRLFELIAKANDVAPPKYQIPSFILHIIGRLGDFLTARGYSTGFSSENAWTATLYHWFDSSKAQKELDFQPGSAEVAIRSSVKWMKENGLLKKEKIKA
jgi:dihydroflavonol-4-reductase